MTICLIFSSTVELDFKNRQDKNQLGFKNQITNDQLDQISFKNRQDKNNLTLRTKMIVTRNILKVKFDSINTKDWALVRVRRLSTWNVSLE